MPKCEFFASPVKWELQIMIKDHKVMCVFSCLSVCVRERKRENVCICVCAQNAWSRMNGHIKRVGTWSYLGLEKYCYLGGTEWLLVAERMLYQFDEKKMMRRIDFCGYSRRALWVSRRVRIFTITFFFRNYIFNICEFQTLLSYHQPFIMGER